MNSRIFLVATSHPDEDRMIVEINVDGENIAELVESPGGDEILLYPNPAGGAWAFPAALLVEALDAASIRMAQLLGRKT